MKLKRFTFISLFLLVVLCFFGVASAEYSIEIGNMSTDTIQEKVLVETYPNGSANPGDIVQISISAEAGYEMDYLEVYQKTGNGLLQINSFSSAEGSSFVMPDGNVLVKVLYTALNPQIVATGTYGGDTAWSLDENGTLTVSGTGSVTSCEYGHYVVKVIIQSGITEIGDNAFEGIDISEVEMADTVTSVGEAAFRDNWTLKRAVLSSGILHISRGCFAACTGLTDLMIPSGVISIEDFALASTALTTITIPSSVTYISPTAFNFDPSVMKKTMEFIVEDDNSVYASQDGVLFNKDKTELIRFPVGRTGEYTIPDTVTTIGANAFASCDLSILTIPQSVTSIGNSYSFEFSELTDIYYYGTEEAWQAMIPDDLELPETTNLHFAIASGSCGDNVFWMLDENGLLSFSGVGKISDQNGYDNPWNEYEDTVPVTGVRIEEGITGIGFGVFHCFRNVSALTIPASVTEVGANSFNSHYNSLTEINVADENSIYASIDGVLFNKDLTELIRFPHSKEGDYQIPASVTTIGSNAFSHSHLVTNVTIPVGVTIIGEQAFEDTDLTEIQLSAGLNYIGDYAFAMTNQLVEMTIPGGVSEIGFSVFGGGLTRIVFEEGITAIPMYCFDGSPELKSVVIPSSMTSIGNYAFPMDQLAEVYYGGTQTQWNAIEIGIGNNGLDNAIFTYNWAKGPAIMDSGSCGDSVSWSLDEYGLLTISGSGTMDDYSYRTAPWYNNHQLIKKVIIGSGVANIGDYAFWDCNNLSEIDISESVISIGEYAFSYCVLTDVTVPGTVLSIGNYSFRECENLTNVTLEEGVISVGDFVFPAQLTSISFPASVQKIGSFEYSSNWSNLEEINVADDNEYYRSVNGVLYNKSMTELIKYPQKKQGSEYEIPDTVTTISPVSCNWTQFTSVTIPDGVTTIPEHAFEGCNVIELTLPDSVTSIGDYAFAMSAHLTEINLSKNLRSIGDQAFAGCSSLTAITIPLSTVFVNYDAFDYTPPAVITGYYGTMAHHAALVCRHTFIPIKPAFTPDFILPQGVKKIEEEAFSGIEATSIKLSEATETIGSRAFSNCKNLKQIYIPASVTSISSDAFEEDDIILIYGMMDSEAYTYACDHINCAFVPVDE